MRMWIHRRCHVSALNYTWHPCEWFNDPCEPFDEWRHNFATAHMVPWTVTWSYLVTAYSLSPLWSCISLKVPMQPRSFFSLPIRQVTNSGLKEKRQHEGSHTVHLHEPGWRCLLNKNICLTSSRWWRTAHEAGPNGRGGSRARRSRSSTSPPWRSHSGPIHTRHDDRSSCGGTRGNDPRPRRPPSARRKRPPPRRRCRWASWVAFGPVLNAIAVRPMNPVLRPHHPGPPGSRARSDGGGEETKKKPWSWGAERGRDGRGAWRSRGRGRLARREWRRRRRLLSGALCRWVSSLSLLSFFVSMFSLGWPRSPLTYTWPRPTRRKSRFSDGRKQWSVQKCRWDTPTFYGTTAGNESRMIQWAAPSGVWWARRDGV